MQVLAIEDSDVDFCFIERALGTGYQLTRATSLAKGLELAATGNFDLLILDLCLDDSKGYETFERAHSTLPRIPIVVLSGISDEDLEIRAVANGAQDFVRKSQLLDFPLGRTARYAVERSRAENAARKAEQKYRVLFDNLPTAAYTCNAEGLITYYNKQAIHLWGRSPGLNQPADRYCGSFKLLAPDGNIIPHDQSPMARALREQKSFTACEIHFELPNGERHAALAHANPVFDEHKTLQGAINVLVDISSHQRAEREIRESERFARSTVNSLAAHIAILDEHGTILAANSAWERFARSNDVCNRNHGVGVNYLEICDGSVGEEAADAQAAAAGIRAVLRRDQDVFELEYPCHSPTEERWFMMRATPFEGEGPMRVVVSHENITSRILAERLAREQSGLREAVAGMEQVLGIVGHELRTPLAALGAISEFLLTDGARDTVEADQFLHEISQEVSRMSDTVNNLLEAARLNSGRAKWNWSDVNLAEIIDEATASVRPLIDSSQVQIAATLYPTQNHMLGDADAVRRLLINLLSNARKHTTHGRIDIGTRHYTDLRGRWIELSVTDTGCGISPEITARLGEAFALNSGVVGSNHVSGTGLGLAICKGIATAHGGSLLIESVEGQGTTVTARLRVDLEAAATGDSVRFDHIEGVAA